ALELELGLRHRVGVLDLAAEIRGVIDARGPQQSEELSRLTGEVTGRNAGNEMCLPRPDHAVGLEVPVPHADARGVECQLEATHAVAHALFGRALFGDVGVRADPLDDVAALVGHGDAVHGEGPVLAVAASHAMHGDQLLLGADRAVPGLARGVQVVGMNRIDPSHATQFVGALAGECAPAGLLAARATVG